MRAIERGIDSATRIIDLYDREVVIAPNVRPPVDHGNPQEKDLE